VTRPRPGWRIADLKGDLKNASTAEEAYFVETESYTTDVSELHKRGFSQHPDVQIKIFPGEGGLKKSFIIVGRNVKEVKRTFIYDSTSGIIKDITGEGVSVLAQLLYESTYPFEKEYSPVKNTSR